MTTLYLWVYSLCIKLKVFRLVLFSIIGFSMVSCGDSLYIVGGERKPVKSTIQKNYFKEINQPKKSNKINLYEQKLNKSWTHRNGDIQHSIQHPKLNSNFDMIWRTRIGSGNTRKTFITADPIIYQKMIFVLDSKSQVSAVNLTGQTIWFRSLVPNKENSKDASGGGLSFSDNSVYAVTGFGDVFRLDAVSGKVIWKSTLNVSISAPPTVDDDLVYVVAKDNSSWALDKKNGEVKWFRDGAPSKTMLVGGAAPAVKNDLVVIPRGSGEVIAVLKESGIPVWISIVSGQRVGQGYANSYGITSDPVIKGDNVFVGNQSGSIISINIKSGVINWVYKNGSNSPVWVDKDSVFLISDQSELKRLDRENGKLVWSIKLPYFVNSNKKDRSRIIVHYGPILAGGMLIVVSSNGLIYTFAPQTGKKIRTISFKGGAATNPVVANNTLYIVTNSGELIAFN